MDKDPSLGNASSTFAEPREPMNSKGGGVGWGGGFTVNERCATVFCGGWLSVAATRVAGILLPPSCSRRLVGVLVACGARHTCAHFPL